jgi:hypothetical protein
MTILLIICIKDELKIPFAFFTLSNMLVFFFPFQIDIDVEQLVSLRQAQISCRLADEVPSSRLLIGGLCVLVHNFSYMARCVCDSLQRTYLGSAQENWLRKIFQQHLID